MAYSAYEQGHYNLEVYRGVSAAYYSARYIEGKQDITLEDAFGVLEYRYLTHEDHYKIAFFDNLNDPSTFHCANKGISIREARENFIGAIEDIFGYNEGASYKNIDLYILFFETIRERNNISIMTTNYDLVCETALEQLNGYTQFPAYHVFDSSFQPVPVLKLHGSIDWKETPIDLPNIIPPTWMKSFERQGKYGFIWRCAEEAISSCDILIFIGYSMQEIDKEVQYLIKSGLQPRIREYKSKRVIVVNPDKTVENRYNWLKNYGTVEKYEFIPKYFRDFVKINLDYLV